MEDIVVRDESQSRLGIAVLASIRSHSLDAAKGYQGSGTSKRHIPSIKTIHEEDEPAEQDELGKVLHSASVSPSATSHELPGFSVRDSPRQHSPFAQSFQAGTPEPFTRKLGIGTSEPRSSSDSALLLDTKPVHLQAMSEGHDRKSPRKTAPAVRSSPRLSLRSKSSDPELSPGHRRISPSRPRLSPKAGVSKPPHYRPSRANSRRKNYAVDFTNDPGGSHPLPV